jgi:ribonuclease VapC
MAQVVFDASAVVAILKKETGADFAANFIGKALVSTVNLQEIIKVLLITGTTLVEIMAMVEILNLDIRPHTVEDAYAAAALFQATKMHGCGLGDRTCMALAIKEKVPVITTDQSWAKLNIEGLEVILAR